MTSVAPVRPQTNESPSLLRRLLAPLLLIAISFSFVAANAPAHDQMSPFDEYVYIDYLVKFPEEGIVKRGEPTGDIAREYYSCVGVFPFGTLAPQNCASGDYGDDEDYPFEGTNSADIYTPLYFGATWLMAQPIMWITGADLVESGRLAGGAWLAIAAVMLYLALGRLQIAQTVRVATSTLMVCSISAWWANTYVSTDATALAAGATMLLLSLRFMQTGRGAQLLVLAALVVTLLKLQNFMAVAFSGLFILVTVLSRGSRVPATATSPSTKRAWLTVGTMFLIPMLAQIGWSALRSALTVTIPENEVPERQFGWPEAVREMLKYVGKIGSPTHISPEATAGWALSTVLSWTLIAGLLAAVAWETRWSTRYNLAAAWAITAISAGPALVIATLAIEGFYFELPVRYGLSLLPSALALAACLFNQKRETRIIFSALAALTFVASLTPYYPGAEMLS